MKVIPTILILVCFLATANHVEARSKKETALILNELKEIRSALNRIADELSEIRASKEKQSKANQLLSGTSTFTRQGPDIDKLVDITLPDNASPDEIKKYIREIITASQGQSTYSDHDPQVLMLTKIGKENISLLIDSYIFSGSMTNFHIEYAILKLADESSKNVILNALPMHHNLVKAVVQNGWEADARDIILKELKKGGQYLPVEWIKTAAGYGDSESYDLLKKYFVNGKNQAQTYSVIQYFPIEKLSEAVAEAWERGKYDNEYNRISMATVAVRYGHLDALEVLVDVLASGNRDNYWVTQEARPAVLQSTDFRGSNAELKDWFEANRSLLRFDTEKKKFVMDSKG